MDLSKFTDEEISSFEEEFRNLIKKYVKLEQKEIQHLKEAGKWKGGLDGHYPELTELSRRMNKEIDDLKERINTIWNLR